MRRSSRLDSSDRYAPGVASTCQRNNFALNDARARAPFVAFTIDGTLPTIIANARHVPSTGSNQPVESEIARRAIRSKMSIFASILHPAKKNRMAISVERMRNNSINTMS